MHADSLKIEADERGFVLIVQTDTYEDPLVINIHACAVELYDQVRREIRPYVLEMEHARITMPPSYDPADAYDTDDPKHPMFHETMVGMWDSRPGK